jgi:hypothetical protein
MATWSMQSAARGRSVTCAQAATGESAPTLATEGMNLDSVGGFDLTVACDEGETFSAPAAGTLQAYRYFSTPAAWFRAPEFDVTIPAAVEGLRYAAFPGWTVANPHGRIAHIADSVSVSGGGLTIAYTATSIQGEPI